MFGFFFSINQHSWYCKNCEFWLKIYEYNKWLLLAKKKRILAEAQFIFLLSLKQKPVLCYTKSQEPWLINNL